MSKLAKATKFVTGSKTFEVNGYSYTKRIGDGSFVQSDSFAVGVHDWAVEFYPHGFNKHGTDHVGAGLRLLSLNKEAKAIHAFYLFDYSANEWAPMMTAESSPLLTYSTLLGGGGGGTAMWGRDRFVKRSDLEAANSKYLQDDTLSIKCIVWVEVVD